MSILKNGVFQHLTLKCKHLLYFVYYLSYYFVFRTIVSITEDESNKNGDDGALKSLKLVFNSLFSSTSSPSVPSNSSTAAQPNAFAQTLMSFMQPTIVQQDENRSPVAAEATPQTEQIIKPEQLLSLIEPLINESLVKEIQTLYGEKNRV